jgi:transcriptional regulator with XRE-family HTH domain
MRTAQFLDQPLNIHLRKYITSKDVANVASVTGVSQDAVRQWRSGYTQPRIELIGKLAKYFGVTTDYLLGNEEATTHARADICKQTGLDSDSVSMLLSLPDELKPALKRILTNQAFLSCLADCIDSKKIDSDQKILDANLELNFDLSDVYRNKLEREVGNLI